MSSKLEHLDAIYDLMWLPVIITSVMTQYPTITLPRYAYLETLKLIIILYILDT